jgi:radical SAM family uncharacterized protein/radical SAM-linked protein
MTHDPLRSIVFEDFLPLVAKPARYIDNEINAVHKDLSKIRTKVCLLFPDTYEVGMSHLGIRILYDILNSREDTACERVFSPWMDYEKRLRASGRPLTSLESDLPLSEFDIIGITLQYELSYSNILTALDLARIPLRRTERNDTHPVIVAGGPCAVNPGPLSDFIDVFFIGDAEESLHEIVELKQAHKDRQAFLAALSKREGFFVPSLPRKNISRRILRSLESAAYPARPLLPLMKPIHDRVTVEIARGCIRGCRFCQAGIIYRPYRERSPETIKGLIRESLACTGYEELSLASLSSGDYSEIGPLMKELVATYKKDRVSLSLPSLRVGTLTPEMVRTIADIRKSGFTLAPEAGTERLRRVINKALSEADLMDAVETIFSSGWSVLKLYFMIGLPTETQDDLDGIIRLCNNVLALGKRTTKRNVQINVTVSTFVPKPHTPFQWFGQTPIEEIRAKQEYLEKGLRRRGITLKPHNPETSLLEAAFARGDSSLGKVIEKAVQSGCRFDGWSECFDFCKWDEAFRACGMELASFAYRQYGIDDPLPWEFIETGVTTEFLKREYARALSAEITDNCRVQCEGCGIGCEDGGSESLGKPQSGGVQTSPPSSAAKAAREGDLVTRIRFKYTKTDRLRFLSHLDLMTLFQRAAARAGVPLAFSQGFNPHPKMSFGPALPVGVESETEYLDMETDPLIDLLTITKSLNQTLPPGIRILEARIVPRKAPSLSGSISRYTYRVQAPDRYDQGLADRVRTFMAQASVVVEKEGKQKDIRPAIESISTVLSASGTVLEVTLQDKDNVRARIQDVVEKIFEIGPEESAIFRIRRTALFCSVDGRWAGPMDVA